MKCLWIILLVSILSERSNEVELSMRGTVNLGKDVVKALEKYIQERKNSGRRLYSPREVTDAEEDTIPEVVSSEHLCKEFEFCKGDLGTLLNKYITMLTEGVESIFKGLINDINDNNHDENTDEVIIFKEELKEIMKDIKKLVRIANEVIEPDLAHTWINLIKRISAKFLERAIIFASQRLEGNAEEILEVKNNLAQKIVIVTSLIELKFENSLCSQHDICVNSFECTKAMNSVLHHLETVSEDKLKEFIKYFQESLDGTNFYNRLSDVTANEFRSILRDMSKADSVLNKNIIIAVHKNTEERQKLIITKFSTDDNKFGKDVKLVHIILSDMDFLYSKQEDDPFHDFFLDFYDWMKEGGRIDSSLRRLMKDIQNKLSFAASDLVMKLIDEVKVFMELTVDPAP